MAKVSVILCTYNRDMYLGTTLDCLGKQKADTSLFEVLIIDNGSTDDTKKIGLEFIDSNKNISATYYLEKQQGLSHARNRGINESSGDILTFIDDDAFVDNNYVDEVIRFFDLQTDAAAFGGKIAPKYESNKPKWMSRFLLPLVAALDMGPEIKKFGGGKFPIGANMGFRKKVFEQYGDFNTELGRKGKGGLEGGEEKDLFYRLKNNQEPIYYTPKIAVTHIIPDRRLQMDYIKGQAMGVGSSEKKRIGKLGIGGKLHKIYSELIKITGTIVLALYYGVLFQLPKAKMLIQFRCWVLKGYWRG